MMKTMDGQRRIIIINKKMKPNIYLWTSKRVDSILFIITLLNCFVKI